MMIEQENESGSTLLDLLTSHERLKEHDVGNENMFKAKFGLGVFSGLNGIIFLIDDDQDIFNA